MNNKLTQYEDVNSIVLLLLRKSQGILGENLLAMYLQGSLAIGDFNPKGSDIDFLIVLNKELSVEATQKLREMLGELAQLDPKWSKKLEGSFVPKAWLKSVEPPKTPRPYINRGGLNMYPYGYEWVLEKFIIREKGIVVMGPLPATLIDSVFPDDVRRANAEILRGDWEPLLSESSRLKDDEYQAYAVLTMCRCLYLFTHDEMVSKKVAAKWAQEKFNEWKKLVEVALNWTSGKQFNRLNEVMDFIKFTIEFTKRNEKDNIA